MTGPVYHREGRSTGPWRDLLVGWEEERVSIERDRTMVCNT